MEHQDLRFLVGNWVARNVIADPDAIRLVFLDNNGGEYEAIPVNCHGMRKMPIQVVLC